jgi:hypothetical protein
MKRTDNMSSLSPNEDTRRMGLTKSVAQMPHYLAREYNKHKGGKEWKKRGGGVKKQAKENNSSLDDDSSNTSVKPRKKSREATGGQ